MNTASEFFGGYLMRYTVPYVHRVEFGIGHKAKAVISHPWIEPARIDLDEIFRHRAAESRAQ